MNEQQSPRELPPPPASTSVAPGPSVRALRTMAIVRWMLLAVVTLLAAYTVWTFWGPAPHDHAEHEEEKYYCPMHPQIRSPQPGECPICHMKLEPIPMDRRDAASSRPASAPASSTPHTAPPEVTAVTVSEEKQRGVGIVTAVVASAPAGQHLRVPAIISAPETGLAQVRVRAPGFVEQVTVRQTGVRVSAGQALAFIYSPEIYRAQEEYLATTRWTSATSTPPGSADIAAAARQALELLGMSTADIDSVTQSGKPIRAVAVRAPRAGYVTRFNAILGSRAEPESVLYEIADLSQVWVIASVHEHDVNQLHVGVNAQFTHGGTAAPLHGKVDLIEPLLDEATRTTRVRVVLPNRDGRLRPGQFGEMEFELPAAAGLFVPMDAVIRTGESEYVYVATAADRFEPRQVRVGAARAGLVQVLSGVSEGERVVTRGNFMLDSESRLQASLAAAPAPSSSATSTHQGHGR